MVTRLLKKVCVDIVNKKWIKREDFREFVLNGSCENVNLC